MNADALLDEFRALGGVAENVRIGDGAFGRGVLVVDPAKPARVHASVNLLFPLEHMELHGEQLRMKPGAYPERESAFFDAYQQHFGWSAGGYDYERRSQERWSTLPDEIRAYIASMGGLNNDQPRFAPPALDACLVHFVYSRQFEYEDGLYLVPIVDLVNHASVAPSYIYEEGIGVTSALDGELRVRYNVFDEWMLMMIYGFSDRALFAYSMGITVGLHNGISLSIGRSAGITDVRDGIAYPKMQQSNGTIELTNLMLGNLNNPKSPRAIFRRLMDGVLTQPEADETFDVIRQFNVMKFLELLRLLRGNRGELIDQLTVAALNQLEALASCVGAMESP